MKNDLHLLPDQSTPMTADALLLRNARALPRQTAFWFDDQRLTWAETEHLAHLAAEWLLQKGICKGTHLGFWSFNHPDLIIFLLGAMKIGAVPAVINYSYRDRELREVLTLADIEYLFLGEGKPNMDYPACAARVAMNCPKLKEVLDLHAIMFGLRSKAKEQADSFILSQAATCSGISPEDTLCMVFSSGTTRTPKAVLLTHRNVISDVTAFTDCMQIQPEDVLLAPLPLFHCSGISGMLFFSLVTGIPAIVHRRFCASEAVRDTKKYRASVLMAVPSMLEAMADLVCQTGGANAVASLRICQSSGSFISPGKLTGIVKTLGLSHLFMGYGQTECSPLVTISRREDDFTSSISTCGRPLPGVLIRIWDLNKDAAALPGVPGEIQVMGPNVCSGYYNDPAATAAKFTSDGWLKTTDAGWLDTEGRLHFYARLSEIIIRRGENISPAEIEAVLLRCFPEVSRIKVVGVPDPLAQEEIACLIEAKEDAVIDPEQVCEALRPHLASYKIPKYIFYVTTLPETSTGKIDLTAAKRLAFDLTKRFNHD